ncbi:MAG: M20/M25/M40 family metallo-hydrolase [Chitinophagaceae bacterium]
MRVIIIFFVLFFSGFVSPAQNADSAVIRNIASEILINSKAYDNLRFLTRQIGPRLAGSAGMIKSEEWAFRTFQESGADKIWKQQCLVPHWIRGGKDEAGIMTFQSTANAIGKTTMLKKLEVIALGNSIGTGAKGIVDNVVLVNSFEELEEKKDQVAGKIVFYNYKFNPLYINNFLAYRDAAQYRSQGPSRASKYGAIAVIVRSMSNSTDNIPHTGATHYDTSYPSIPAVAIGLKDADILSEKLGKEKVSVFIRTNGKFLPDAIGHNVIGELKGSEFPGEIITVGGHLDSWDNSEGAHDDGAGCVQTIEILRAFKSIGYKPKRTIRFVLFANEENGLAGATKYAEEAKAKNEKHIFALESDAGGFTPRGFGFVVSDEQFKKILSWRELIAPYGAGDFVRGGGGADIGPLNKTFGTPLAGLAPDTQRYFDIHHARSDVFENVNKRELELGAVNMAALTYLVDQYGLP